MDNIAYYNTKEGMHATAKERGISPWALGCDCFDCNRQFEAVRAGLPTEQPDSVGINIKPLLDGVGSDSMLARQIWNEAIEKAALEVEKQISKDDHFYVDIRKLKK